MFQLEMDLLKKKKTFKMFVNPTSLGSGAAHESRVSVECLASGLSAVSGPQLSPDTVSVSTGVWQGKREHTCEQRRTKQLPLHVNFPGFGFPRLYSEANPSYKMMPFYEPIKFICRSEGEIKHKGE